MTHINIRNNKLRYDLLAGNEPERVLKEKPFEIFNKDAINFLSKLSKKLIDRELKSQDFRDFRGFGFWIREANLINMRNSRNDIKYRVGRGVSFHIAPSNIAANSLYSLAFGLLSGCPTIIRLSHKNISELESIMKLVRTIFENNELSQLSNKISLINYEHDETINNYFSSQVDSRIIWGGMKLFKSLNHKTASHCLDIVFPNKDQSSIIK